MAAKYAGQNALNKLMQLVKTALNNKADKTNATTSAAGLMSAADKTKLDGIAAGGVTVDTEMSSTSTNAVQNKVVKSYVDTKVSGLQTASQVQAAINKAIVGVYTPRGSIQFANLPQPQEGNKGYVYNVLDAFTTTAAFIEGAGHSYGAGTNVVCGRWQRQLQVGRACRHHRPDGADYGRGADALGLHLTGADLCKQAEVQRLKS